MRDVLAELIAEGLVVIESNASRMTANSRESRFSCAVKSAGMFPFGKVAVAPTITIAQGRLVWLSRCHSHFKVHSGSSREANF